MLGTKIDFMSLADDHLAIFVGDQVECSLSGERGGRALRLSHCCCWCDASPRLRQISQSSGVCVLEAKEARQTGETFDRQPSDPDAGALVTSSIMSQLIT